MSFVLCTHCRIRVVLRRGDSKGVATGYVTFFDSELNLIMRDVDDESTISKPVKERVEVSSLPSLLEFVFLESVEVESMSLKSISFPHHTGLLAAFNERIDPPTRSTASHPRLVTCAARVTGPQ